MNETEQKILERAQRGHSVVATPEEEKLVRSLKGLNWIHITRECLDHTNRKRSLVFTITKVGQQALDDDLQWRNTIRSWEGFTYPKDSITERAFTIVKLWKLRAWHYLRQVSWTTYTITFIIAFSAAALGGAVAIWLMK